METIEGKVVVVRQYYNINMEYGYDINISNE